MLLANILGETLPLGGDDIYDFLSRHGRVEEIKLDGGDCLYMLSLPHGYLKVWPSYYRPGTWFCGVRIDNPGKLHYLDNKIAEAVAFLLNREPAKGA